MAQEFSDLPAEKRRQITAAAIQVFAEKGYRQANTRDIAAKAGISKGLLFYYFKNKKSLYLYLADCLRQSIENRMPASLSETGDFFEILDLGAAEKMDLLRKTPWALDFAVKMYYTADREIAPSIRRYVCRMLDDMFQRYFAGVNTEKFRPEVSPRQALDLLVQLMDGYIHQQLLRGKPLDMDAVMAEYQVWKDVVRKYAYKEEYQ